MRYDTLTWIRWLKTKCTTVVVNLIPFHFLSSLFLVFFSMIRHALAPHFRLTSVFLDDQVITVYTTALVLAKCPDYQHIIIV